MRPQEYEMTMFKFLLTLDNLSIISAIPKGSAISGFVWRYGYIKQRINRASRTN